MLTNEWMSTEAASAYIGVTSRTLYRFIDEGQLRAYRFGRVIRLRTADVETPCSRTVSPRRSASTRLNTTYAPLTTTSTTSRTALCAESTNEGRERPKSARRTWPVP